MFNSVGLPGRFIFQRARAILLPTLALLMFAAIAAGSVYAAGTISGTAYRDFNGNGAQNTGEVGIAGIDVEVFDSSNASQGTDTTDANGNYSISAGGTGPYRVEFTIPTALAPYQPAAQGTGNDTSIQFVPDGNSSNVDFAVNYPNDYCQNNPDLCTTSYVNGARTDASVNTRAAQWQWPYSNQGVGLTQTKTADYQDIGATWGLALARSTEQLYIGAYLRRHSDIGPGDGAGSNPYGAIYVRSLGSTTPTYFATIPNAGTITGRDMTTGSAPSYDPNAYANIGKLGLGNLTISEDEETLYVMNLYDRSVYPVTIGTATVGAAIPVPDPGCTNGTYRPFATKFWHGLLYVGMVCDASGGGTKADLEAVVYTFDPVGATWSASPVLRDSLQMSPNKGSIVSCGGALTNPAWAGDNGYHPWSDDGSISTLASSTYYCRRSGASGNPRILIHPMPILSDIEFDVDGAMILGITDRFGSMIGWRNYGPDNITPDTTVYDVIVGGDVLRACDADNNGVWTLESNGSCGGTAGAGVGNGQGIGGGEFYVGDLTEPDTSQEEATEGGLAFVPGRNHIVSTMQDPNTATIAQGIVFMFNSGANVGESISGDPPTAPNGYQLYVNSTANATVPEFGKANGLGDLLALCDAAPVEIGNRVWNDADGDGIQDPDEAVLSSIDVTLWVDTDDNGSVDTQIATARTDANGNYYFSNDPRGYASGNTSPNDVTGGGVSGGFVDDGQGGRASTASAKFGLTQLIHGQNFEIRLDTTSAQNAPLLSGLNLTTQNAGSKDTIDSDAAMSGSNAVVSASTQLAGYNNHTYDIGFAPAATSDYGDLPDTGAGTGSGNYQTLASDGGPSHTIVAGLNIGAPDVVDAETGLLQNATATADDNSDTGYADDEDGIASFPTFTPGSPATVDVTVNNVSGSTATLYGFIDWNGDGDFGDTDEVASVTVPDATVGTVSLNFNVPAGALTGTNLGARFRLTTDTLSLDNNGAIGAASDGEVEDYIIRVQGAGAIGNYVWFDENSDGYQDKGEVGIPNVTVQLKDSGGNVIATQVTDSNGGYLFTGLGAGTYYVEVDNTTIPTGMTQTTTYPNNGADFYNQNQGGAGYQIVLGAGQTNLTADFGYNWNPTTDITTGGAVNADAALGDRIWIDTNGDGAQDANEIGVQGVEVTLYGSPGPDNIWGNGDDVPYTTGGYIPTRTTDANGFYMFDDLPPGQYAVRVTNSASASHNVLDTTQYTQTGDADHWGTTGTVNDNQTTIPVVLGPGDVFLNADFGYQPGGSGGTPALGSIGNFVWYDRDADGVGPGGNGAAPGNDNTEFGLGGVTVALIQDLNANGRWDAGEPIIATSHTSNGTEDVDGDGTTDPIGFYRFRSLPITDGVGTDDYLVWVNDTNHVLDGLVATYDKDGGSPVSGLATGLGISAVTNLGTTGGSPYGTNDATDQDFGYTDSAVPGATDPGMIGDRVWLDLNSDGVQDANEPGIPGVRVVLYDSDGTTLLATTTTGANGLYLFPNLNVDDGGGSHQYFIEVNWTTLPGGMLQTYDDDDGTGPFNTPDRSTATLSAGTPVNLNQDFGYVGSGSIGNFVWLDTNANGIVDGSDASQGIAGVTIDLYDDVNRNRIVDAGDIKLSTTTTDANGGYLFTGLPTEDIDEINAYYVVNVTDTAGVLTGFWHSLGNQAVASDNTSKASPYSVILATGSTATENVLTVDFGYYVVPGAVGNYVWLDTDKNGIQNAGENGVNGVTVTLEITYPNGTVTTITTVTQTEPGGTRDGWYSFGNLLQDENYNGLGTYGQEPTFNITATLPPGYTASPMGNGTPTTDSNDPTGTGAQPFKGQINTLFANDSASISSYDFGMYLSPTAVDVKKVRVKVTADNTVLLRWRSVSEAQITGFNIQRSDAADGAYANVNTEFIPAKASGSALGKGYKFLDSSVAAGSTYWYRIEIAHTDASVAATEPRRVTVGDGACNTALTAPELLAPINDVQVKAGQVRLKWNPVTCAAYYRVQVKPDARDAKLVLNRKHLKTALTVKDLVKGANYQWRVQACSANGECVAAEWQTFTVKK